MYGFQKASWTLALLFICLVSFTASAKDLSEADQRAANAYRLSEKNLAQFEQATRSLNAAMEKDPTLVERAQAAAPNESKGIADLVQFFEKIPDAKKAIESSGMTVRDYWLFHFAMVYAGTGHMAAKAGMDVPATFSKENIAFYGSHEANFMKLGKDLQRMGKLMEGKSSSEEQAEEETEDETEE